MKVIAETPKYKLVYYEDSKIIHHTFTDKIDDEGFKEVLSMGKDIIAEHGADRWVSDNRQVRHEFSPESFVWLETEWQPEVIGMGWKFWALVVPEAMFAQVNHMDYIESNFEKGVWVTVHTELEPALEWARTAEFPESLTPRD